ncbi:hypothetical protein MMC13_001737 [Lambiella insularis]|nr:hypothetical protein [Lambiella insularis]
MPLVPPIRQRPKRGALPNPDHFNRSHFSNPTHLLPANMTKPFTIRPPFSPSSSTSPLPSPAWLAGTWHVTHSTLPMWKSARNVTITYEPLPPLANQPPQLLDTVAYQPLHGDKRKTIRGVDTASADGRAWDWRGKGWLKIASSRWEVLGWGECEGGRWAVTYFQKSLFSPAGIDVYERGEVGEGVVRGVREALGGMEEGGVGRLVEEMVEVRRD